MVHIDLLRLRAFVAAAEAGTLSRAGEVLHLTQPALSKQIRSLEEELGVRLFHREGSGVKLTSAGQDLLQRSRQLLQDVESLAERARVLKNGATGLLKVGATSMTIESVLAPFLPRFRRRWPKVDLAVTEEGGMRLLRQVDEGSLHLAITGPRLPHLQYRTLFPVRSIAVMGSTHRLARQRSVELRQLAAEPLLVLRKEFTLRQLFDAACHMACLTPRIVFETGVPSALLAMVRVGQGVAIVPSNQPMEDRKLRRLAVAHEGKSLGQWMAVNWHPRRPLAPYAEAFVAELTAYTERAYPGKEFSGAAPVPLPDEHGAVGA